MTKQKRAHILRTEFIRRWQPLEQHRTGGDCPTCDFMNALARLLKAERREAVGRALAAFGETQDTLRDTRKRLAR